MQTRVFERFFSCKRASIVRYAFLLFAFVLLLFVSKHIWLDNRIMNAKYLYDIPVIGRYFPNVAVEEVRYVRHQWRLFYSIDVFMRGRREQFSEIIGAIYPNEIGKACLPGSIGSFRPCPADFPNIPDGVEFEYAIGSFGHSSRQVVIVVFVPGKEENSMGVIYLKCY